MVRSIALVFTAAALAASCTYSETTDDDQVGQLDLALVGQSSAGVSYRLRDAELRLFDGARIVTFSTEDDPDRTAITGRVPSGPYNIELAPGWRLEQLVTGGAPVPVTATLLSPNPQSFQINPDALTQVSLRFGVNGDQVALGEGDFSIGVDVEVLPDAGGQSLILDQTTVDLPEGASTAFGVRLLSQPSQPVTIAVTTSDAARAQLEISSLTIQPATWNQWHSIQVHAGQDDDVATDVAHIQLATPGLPALVVPVTITDDDLLVPVLDIASAFLDEGTNAVLGVRLSHRPAHDIVVVMTSSRPDAVVVSPPLLTFTPDSWSIPQQSSLQAVLDADTDHAEVQIQATSGGTSSTFGLTVVDTTLIPAGWPLPPSELVASPSGMVTAYAITLTAPLDVRRLQIFAMGHGAVRMAIYASQGNSPGQVLAMTNIMVVSGATQAVNAAVAPTVLAPGQYWLAVANDASLSYGLEPASGPLVTRCRTSGGPATMPGFLGNASCSQQRAISIAAFGRP